MHSKTLAAVLALLSSLPVVAQDEAPAKPSELEMLKASVGVWDAHCEVWPQGPGSNPVKFKGVETIRAYGEYWLTSDFDSSFMGQTTKVHSLMGYDLDKKKLVGTIVDQGPYSASMTGVYDTKTKTTHWETRAKHPSGKPMLQKTSIAHKSSTERLLTLKMPNEKGEFAPYMQIRLVKRKK